MEELRRRQTRPHTVATRVASGTDDLVGVAMRNAGKLRGVLRSPCSETPRWGSGNTKRRCIRHRRFFVGGKMVAFKVGALCSSVKGVRRDSQFALFHGQQRADRVNHLTPSVPRLSQPIAEQLLPDATI
jgi:hypothetical protein